MFGLIGAIAGPVIGGLFGKDSASDASGIQAQATQAAIDEQRRQYDQTRTDLAPWRQAGGSAENRIAALLGIGPRNDANSRYYGDLNERFHVSDFMSDPVVKLGLRYGLQEGRRGINNMAGASGMLNSGNTLKALTRFGQDYAGSQAQNAYNRFYQNQDRTFNRLAGVSGAGQTANTTLGSLGASNANNIGNLITAGGNARGAATIAGSNAIGGAANSVSNWWNQQQMLNRFFPQGGGGGSGGGYAFSGDYFD